MRVAVVTSQTPFVSGRADWLAGQLCQALHEHGHDTELVRIPFSATPPDVVVDHMLAVRLVHLDNADLVIALTFPAYLLPHHNKVVWLLQQFREAYDPSGRPGLELPDPALGRTVRTAVRAADRRYLGEARRIHTHSTAASYRLSHYLDLPSEVLYPPLHDPGAFCCTEYGDYVLALGGISSADPSKRLAVAAVGLAKSPIRLILAGPPDGPDDLSALQALARRLGVENRIEFIPHEISDSERVTLLADCRAVLSFPFIEDSHEEVTLEAFQSRKPVVVFAPAAGIQKLVRDGVSGCVAGSVEGLAEVFDELSENPALAERYGNAAFRQLQEAGISWQTVVRELTR